MLEMHPRSKNFDWDQEVHHMVSAQRVTPEQWSQYNELGFFVVENLLNASQLADMTAETDASYVVADEFLKKLPDERMFIAERGAISFAPHVALQSPILRQFVLDSPISEIAHDLVGPDARLYHDQVVYKESEKPRRFPWHQDNGYTFVEPQNYLTVWIALTDATVDSGCPWVAPGLHRHGTLKHEYVEPLGFQIFEEPPVSAVSAPVGAGGAVVFSSLTPHLTGPNISGKTRKAYIVQYVGSNATRFEGPIGSAGELLIDDARFPKISVH